MKLKTLFKNLYKHFDQLQKSIISILSVILFSSQRNAIRLSRILKSNYNESCIILGNGPSLKKDIAKIIEIKNEHVFFVVNNFSSSEYYEKLQPKNYIIIDASFWRDNTHPDNIAIRNESLENLKNKTKWPLNLFIPKEAYDSKFFGNFLSSNLNIQIVPINTTPVEGNKFLSHFLFRHNLGMPLPINVLIPCLLLAINSKFKTISLFGVDHSWSEEIFVNNENRLVGYDRHFFNEENKDIKPTSFYHNASDTVNISELFYNFHKAFQAYYIINNYSKEMKSNIINMSSKSFIDAFKRE